MGRHDFVGRQDRELASKLPEDKAALFFKTLEKVRMENRDAHKKIREARKQAMKILVAPVFDETAYRVEVAKLQELHSLIKRRFADATIELAKRFSLQDRKALAQHLRRAQKPFRKAKPPRGQIPPDGGKSPIRD
jgi:uncharacterized membrane protein